MDDSTGSRDDLAARAAMMKALNPRMKWGQIARELGVSERTLRRARDEKPRAKPTADEYSGQGVTKIPFRDQAILTVKVDGRDHIVLKPVFDHIGVDSDTQIKKIQRQPWAVSRMGYKDVLIGRQTYKMITADVQAFLMALASIPAARVNEAARPLLIAYQSEVADVLERYFTQGAAINPRASEEQLRRAEEVIGDVREARQWGVLHSRDVRDIIAGGSDYGTLSDDHKRFMFAGLRDRIHQACVGMKAKRILEMRRGEIQQWTGKKGPTKADESNAMNYLSKYELDDEAVVALDMTVDLRYLVRQGGSYTVNQALSALGRSLDRMTEAGRPKEHP